MGKCSLLAAVFFFSWFGVLLPIQAGTPPGGIGGNPNLPQFQPPPNIDVWLQDHPKIADNIVWESLIFVDVCQKPLPQVPGGVGNPFPNLFGKSPCRPGEVLSKSPVDSKMIPWKLWPATLKMDLRTNFLNYYSCLKNAPNLENCLDPDPMQDPPVNQMDLDYDDIHVAEVLDPVTAWKMYVKHVAWSLAVELSHWVSWSLKDYKTSALQELLNSRRMFTWQNGTFTPPLGTVPLETVSGYMIYRTIYGNAIPASPLKEARYFLFYHLLGLDRLSTIGHVLKWARRLEHVTVWCPPYYEHCDQAGVAIDLWQHAGMPPVSRMIDGTTYSGPYPILSSSDPGFTEGYPFTPDPFGFPQHWTYGCHGTVGFMKAVFRAVNIPVAYVWRAHALAYFMSEDAFLSHGDDPYDLWYMTPDLPGEALLISKDQFHDWFPTYGSDSLKKAGRRVIDLHIEFIPNVLLHSYCDDLAKNLDHASGSVFSFLNPLNSDYPTVDDLENAQLWERIAAKVESFGGCDGSGLPPISPPAPNPF